MPVHSISYDMTTEATQLALKSHKYRYQFMHASCKATSKLERSPQKTIWTSESNSPIKGQATGQKCVEGLQYYRNTNKKPGLKMKKLANVVYIILIGWEM